MSEMLGSDLIPGDRDQPEETSDPTIPDPEFLKKIKPQIEFMEQLLAQIRKSRK